MSISCRSILLQDRVERTQVMIITSTMRCGVVAVTLVGALLIQGCASSDPISHGAGDAASRKFRYLHGQRKFRPLQRSRMGRCTRRSDDIGQRRRIVRSGTTATNLVRESSRCGLGIAESDPETLIIPPRHAYRCGLPRMMVASRCDRSIRPLPSTFRRHHDPNPSAVVRFFRIRLSDSRGHSINRV